MRVKPKRLLTSRRGLNELRGYDPCLYRIVSKYVKANRLTAPDFSAQIDRWTGQLRVRSGDTKTSYRTPGRVLHSVSKSGSIGRPLDVIHMDLANVNRLKPDKQRYRYSFILVAVDAFSNYTVLVPVKDKSAESVLNAIKNAFNQFGMTKRASLARRDATRRRAKLGALDEEDEARASRWCAVTTKLQTDRGSEFVNETLRAFLRRRGVELFSSRGSGKAYLSESKIGQMKRQLGRIQNILEKSHPSPAKKRRRRTTVKKKKKKKKTNVLTISKFIRPTGRAI